MGEFEQAKPVIELIKEKYPDYTIICTFFSPSGYRNQKNYKFADEVYYLPFDTPGNAKKFIDLIQPDIAVFVRYEIWRNYLIRLKSLNIPAYLICATIPGNSLISKFPLNIYTKSNYNFFTRILTAGESHSDFFNHLGVSDKTITLSDARYDRIIRKVEDSRKNFPIKRDYFPKDALVLVAGSTWQPDEELLINAVQAINKKYDSKIYLVIVPHEPTQEHLSILDKKLNENLRYSQLIEYIINEHTIDDIIEYIGQRTLVIDTIGILLGLYSIADISYVGGGFGVGIHSVAEPAGYGIPVACGQNYLKSIDAINLKNNGALTIINDLEMMTSWLESLITDGNARNKAGNSAKDYIVKNSGSSRKIMDIILETIE
jgi:3-deoxy-D-manno-octulosonic-acid transferase